MSELYKLPDGWEWKKLGKVLDVQNGYAFDSKLFNEEIGMQLIRIRDLKNGVITESKYSGEYDDKFLVYKGDFLIGMDGDFICYIWKGEPSLLNQRVCRLVDFSNDLEAKYVFYGINKYLEDIHRTTAFVTVKHISSKQIKDINFPLPPLEEQKRIVEKLDILFAKIDKAIALHQKNINEANVFMASVLNDVFVKLEEKYGLNILSDSVNNPKKDIVDGPFGSDLKATEYIDSGIPIIRLQNIQRFEFINKDIKFISEEKAKQLHRHTFKKGDIVITKLGVPLGKSCIVPNFLDNGIIVADVIRIRVDESKTLVNYINYAINSPIAINQFSDNSAGATRQRVKLTMVRDLKIPLPNIKTQQKIVSYLDEISQKIQILKQIQKEKMESLKALKASILDQAFKGEL